MFKLPRSPEEHKLHTENRVLAAYYRSGGREHPNHDFTGHYILLYEDLFREEGFRTFEDRIYIRLANDNGTLAVFTIDFNSRMRRARRWPKCVDNGTATTEDEYFSESNGDIQLRPSDW